MTPDTAENGSERSERRGMRTDFIDFPTAWEIQHDVGDQLEHHPKCSAPAFLCDCAAVPTEWARRAIELEPEREDEIRVALQRYLPDHMRTLPEEETA